MEVLNETGLEVAWLAGKLGFPKDSITLIVKGTFRLTRDGEAALDPAAKQPPVTGDSFYDDDPDNGIRYENDLVHFKPRADLFLVGSCHTPDGQPMMACKVSFGVGERVKSLGVIGDRAWTSEGPDARASDPAPFTTMPLDYRRTFGGAGFAPNPLGRGFAKTTLPDGRAHWPLPNLVDLKQASVAQGEALTPVGFGPLDRMLPQRRQDMGTYDESWQEERWPWYPADFDWSHFNAAPADQQVEGYLRGDEPLYFENLHPEHAQYRSRLPGLRVRCLLQESYQGRPLIRDVPMRLDTLWADVDAEEIVLLWRGLAAARSQELEEIERLLVVTEPLAETPKAAEHYAGAFAEHLAESEGPLLTPRPDTAPPDANIDYDAAAAEAEVKAEVEKALEEMRAQVRGSRVDFDKVKSIALAADPEAALKDFISQSGLDPQAQAKAIEAGRQRAFDLLREKVQGTGLADLVDRLAAPDAQKEAPSTPSPADRAGPGAKLSGEDLSGADFSGRDLKGADFTDSILAGADFKGAELGEADFTGANLAGANFSGALLEGAVFDKADLTGAFLARVNLAGGSFISVTAAQANLTGANLAGASMNDANLSGADLTGANLEGAVLERGDLSSARLDRANLRAAKLGRADLAGAVGEKVTMTGAEVTELKAGGGRFPGGEFQHLRGEASLWFECDLSSSDFEASDLVRADFREANLSGCNLHTADLRNGNLTGANLGGARFTSVNLFQARLDKADLTEADLRGSNCYEADFVDAVLSGARFQQANLKMTKLDRSDAQG